ncbi:pyridoxal phosphate-dependent aminotransferase [Wenzhouxiangella marina]|uniref:Aminotransferase n=1 Tax=Wenzhouxiangella marina TaxID=1579979 RepID=A0A0K0XS04_9GAMM|nr:pyridoxal phosphate-dependent aminotransferase [Wenzhouxiangella marina]AKS40494.1 aminotransferase [Wenzhouxiangella marina]MBB6088184.1 methionine aminotransferase [Wenzhouxiangella marina]
MNPALALSGQSRLPGVKTTIFSVMSQLAAEHGALNLSQGFPDFECPEHLRELVSEAMRAGHNQYAPMPGVPLLRQRITEKVLALYGAPVDMDREVTVTCGASEALFVAIQTVVRPGDEVILFDPAYDCYEPAVDLAGGRAIHLPLRAPDYRIDWQQLGDAIGPKTRLIVINTPHNPTGSALSADDLDRLAELVADTPVFLIGDEVYEHIVFDGADHQSLLRREELRQRSFVISSFGKTYHTTGWKIGYCIAPAPMTAEFRKIHQYVTFSIATPMQHAIAHFMADPDFHLGLSAFYQQKRDHFRSALEGSRFALLPCQGTYFQLLDYSAISDRPDLDMARWLVEQAGVAAIPVSVFYADGGGGGTKEDRILRFCFAKSNDTLDRACERLRQL